MQKYIDNAVEQFRTLITEQLARQNRMEAGEAAKDFANLPHITIGICGGDGIGPIIPNRPGSRLLLQWYGIPFSNV